MINLDDATGESKRKLIQNVFMFQTIHVAYYKLEAYNQEKQMHCLIL